MSDVILQFKIEEKNQYGITANVDVKATSDDIKNTGKSPNITSFARIGTMYIEVYSCKNDHTTMMDAIMEISAHNSYDLKYISESDISYNPALSTGQIQIRDVRYVELCNRDVWSFCQLLDRKFLHSKKGFKEWIKVAKKYEWIK